MRCEGANKRVVQDVGLWGVRTGIAAQLDYLLLSLVMVWASMSSTGAPIKKLNMEWKIYLPCQLMFL